jgi:membrane-associated phospholipid phosphatase
VGTRLRSSEWALIAFFFYVATVSLFFPLTATRRFATFGIATFVVVACAGLAALERHAHPHVFSMVRDWLPIALMLVAYREMDWFAAAHGTHALERQWIVWDRSLLHAHGMQALVESAGWLGPAFLELSYLLVYGVGPFVVGILYGYHRRELVDRVLLIYLLGTLLAYALFPYFPSDPPRTVFPGADLPGVITPLRRLNLWIVGGYGIHSSVFPSAHVSSAFSAAWGLLFLFKEKRWAGWGMLVYAASVAIATVYGRYHYAVDAVAGLVVSLAALLLAIVLRRRERQTRQC